MGLVEENQLTGSMQSVAIVAYGDEGQSIYNYIKGDGRNQITIIDEAERPKKNIPEDVKSVLGPRSLDDELNYDIVWRGSPAIAPYKIKTKGEIKTSTKEFFTKCPAPIIGITGTKGKGTTASLIDIMLKNTGQITHLIGNIGRPALDELPKIKADDIVIYELSSFQLWDLDKSPHVSVVLMMEPEHLDVHKDLEDYVQAKANISRWQGPDDVTIYHPDNPLTERVARPGLGKKVKYMSNEGANIEGENLVINGQTICTVKDFKLLGKHNHENIAAAVTAAWQYTQDIQAIAKAIKEFRGLPHRLEIVAEKNEVMFVDDSIATTPSTTVAAINSFDQPKILILGGSDKGADFTAMAEAIAKSNVKLVLLIGQMASKIAQALDVAGFEDHQTIENGEDMANVVKTASSIASPGDVVLLSPGCASFGLFNDYKDRGDKFRAAVSSL